MAHGRNSIGHHERYALLGFARESQRNYIIITKRISSLANLRGQGFSGFSVSPFSSIVIDEDGVIGRRETASRFRAPRSEERSDEEFWERSRRDRRIIMVSREIIRVPVPPCWRRDRRKMRIAVPVAVPRSSFGEQRRLITAINVEIQMHAVALGAAYQLVHVAGLYPEVDLVRIHGIGHVLLERRREHPHLLTAVLRGDDL